MCLCVSVSVTDTHTHTHTHSGRRLLNQLQHYCVCVCVYVFVCVSHASGAPVCVSVSVCLGVCTSHRYQTDNDQSSDVECTGPELRTQSLGAPDTANLETCYICQGTSEQESIMTCAGVDVESDDGPGLTLQAVTYLI